MDRYRDLGLLILRNRRLRPVVLLVSRLSEARRRPRRMGGRTGDAVANIGITFGHVLFGLAAALSEGVGGLLFAAGLFFRPVCLAMLGVMIVATIDQVGRDGARSPNMHSRTRSSLAGMFLVGPGRYTVSALFKRR